MCRETGEQHSFKQEGLVDLGCKVQTVTDHEIVTEFCWNGMGLRIKLEWNMKFCHWNGMEIDQEIL